MRAFQILGRRSHPRTRSLRYTSFRSYGTGPASSRRQSPCSMTIKSGSCNITTAHFPSLPRSSLCNFSKAGTAVTPSRHFTSTSAAIQTPFSISPSLQDVAVPLQQWYSENPTTDQLVVGGLVFLPSSLGAGPLRVLVVQRAAEEPAFPNSWELPSGTCHAKDETMLHALTREFGEETGLVVNRFVEKINGFAMTGTAHADDDGFEYIAVHKGRQWSKMCFVVEVQPPEMATDSQSRDEKYSDEIEVTIDPSEHQAYKWASRDEIKDLNIMTERHKEVILLGIEKYLSKSSDL